MKEIGIICSFLQKVMSFLSKIPNFWISFYISVNRGFWFRFRFGSVFQNSQNFGFGSVRFLDFRFGFPVFRLTEQPLHRTTVKTRDREQKTKIYFLIYSRYIGFTVLFFICPKIRSFVCTIWAQPLLSLFCLSKYM